METILIDTDIAIDFLRGSAKAKEFVIPLWENNTAFFSLLSVYELFADMKPGEKEATDNFIKACRIEPLTVEITQWAGDFYQTYRKKGITLTTINCLISSTAKLNNHKIATRNLKHYPDKSLLFKIN